VTFFTGDFPLTAFLTAGLFAAGGRRVAVFTRAAGRFDFAAVREPGAAAFAVFFAAPAFRAFSGRAGAAFFLAAAAAGTATGGRCAGDGGRRISMAIGVRICGRRGRPTATAGGRGGTSASRNQALPRFSLSTVVNGP